MFQLIDITPGYNSWSIRKAFHRNYTFDAFASIFKIFYDASKKFCEIVLFTFFHEGR